MHHLTVDDTQTLGCLPVNKKQTHLNFPFPFWAFWVRSEKESSFSIFHTARSSFTEYTMSNVSQNRWNLFVLSFLKNITLFQIIFSSGKKSQLKTQLHHLRRHHHEIGSIKCNSNWFPNVNNAQWTSVQLSQKSANDSIEHLFGSLVNCLRWRNP